MAGISFGLLVVAIVLGLVALGAYYVLGLVGTLFLSFLLICLLMIVTVLIQRPKGGGLSGAFGGAGGGSSPAVFGSKVGDVLTWATVGFFVAFLGLSMGLTYAIRAEVGQDRQIQFMQPADPANRGTAPAGTAPVDAVEVIEMDADMDVPEAQDPLTPSDPSEAGQ